MADISIEQAWEAVTECMKKSNQLGVKMNIAVVDAGANLKSFARMDGAWLGSIDISIQPSQADQDGRSFDRQSNLNDVTPGGRNDRLDPYRILLFC